MDAATWINLGQLIISIVGITITAWLAVIVQRSTTRIAQLEFNRALRDSRPPRRLDSEAGAASPR